MTFIDDGKHFEQYCNEQLESIKLAIKRKANGSTVEEIYFGEHIDKLKQFFSDYAVCKNYNCDGDGCEGCPNADETCLLLKNVRDGQ
jgi:hypothetical protein